jgi:hypothetical protein
MSDSTLDTNLVPSPGEVMARFRQEVLNDKNVDAIDEIAAEDFIELDPAPGQGAGREGLKRSSQPSPSQPSRTSTGSLRSRSPLAKRSCPASPGTAPTKAPSWGSRPPADTSP